MDRMATCNNIFTVVSSDKFSITAACSKVFDRQCSTDYSHATFECVQTSQCCQGEAGGETHQEAKDINMRKLLTL